MGGAWSGLSDAGDATYLNMLLVTGQGAGVAAAVSVKQGVTTALVNVQDVQAELARQGVRFR
jgi:hypothetical protein